MSNKANKGETWKAKSVDAKEQTWADVRIAAATAGLEIREWIDRALVAAMRTGLCRRAEKQGGRVVD